MSILRKAGSETKTIKLDESDYIVVRADISKREFNALASKMPANVGENGAGLTLADGVAFVRELFAALVVGWSLDDTAPTVTDYDELAASGASAIDTALAEYFNALVPSSAEGK